MQTNTLPDPQAHAQLQPLLAASTAPTPLLQVTNLTKIYPMGQTTVQALHGVSLTIHAGEYVAIVGASGSGKSTLLSIIGLLDRPTSGNYWLQGQEVSRLGKAQLAKLRNQEIGFVFQRFNLLARTNARRQVELPLFYARLAPQQATKQALAALAQVGLADRVNHRPEELSGGQQQRVAIARALVNQPSLLLADEPTGALDSKTSAEILAIFQQLNQQGLTIVVVTHDLQVAQATQRIVTLHDGLVIDDQRSAAA